MSELIGQCEIQNIHTKGWEDASIYEGLNDSHLEDFQNLWKPELINKKNQIRTDFVVEDEYREQIELHKIQDWHWDWIKLNDIATKYDSYKIFSVVCNGKLQGLMRTITEGYDCRIKSQKGKAVVYIDRLAVAPWNRYPWFDPRQYRLVGEVLMGTAISLSIEVGYKGRICLNSLPQANDWYVDVVGMTNCGPDAGCEDLNWYEMIPKNSKIFLGNSVLSEDGI